MGGNQELGRAGEDAAAAWYEHHGYVVLDRNWRTRSGEMDLICHRDDTVVFCEVKTRSTKRFGSGMEAVDRRKQQRLRLLGAQWLQQQPEHYAEIRFDVADVNASGHLEILEGCF